jgi:hypothetical protein
VFVLRVEKIIVVLQPSTAAQLIRWFNPHKFRTVGNLGILVSIPSFPDRRDILHPHSRLSFGEQFLVCYRTCSSEHSMTPIALRIQHLDFRLRETYHLTTWVSGRPTHTTEARGPTHLDSSSIDIYDLNRSQDIFSSFGDAHFSSEVHIDNYHRVSIGFLSSKSVPLGAVGGIGLLLFFSGIPCF